MNGGEAITSRHIILIIIMSKFFYPFIGKDYNQGINGKKYLYLEQVSIVLRWIVSITRIVLTPKQKILLNMI